MSDEPIIHRPAATVPTRAGPASYFTGTVHLEPLSAASAVPTSVLRVTFTPGARTGWHTHPAGQILVVTAGVGLVATRDGWARRITPGDTVEIAAGLEHWHGAGPETLMQHLAIQPDPDTGWLDLVADEDYAATARDAT